MAFCWRILARSSDRELQFQLNGTSPLDTEGMSVGQPSVSVLLKMRSIRPNRGEKPGWILHTLYVNIRKSAQNNARKQFRCNTHIIHSCDLLQPDLSSSTDYRRNILVLQFSSFFKINPRNLVDANDKISLLSAREVGDSSFGPPTLCLSENRTPWWPPPMSEEWNATAMFWLHT